MTDENAALLAWMETVSKVLGEVSEERVRQQIKWGEQNHPDGTGPDLWLSLDAAGYLRRHGIRRADLRDWMVGRTDDAFGHDVGTYEHILSEEWAEAIAESDPVKLRAELIQVAAVAVAWVEKIDRDLRTPPASVCPMCSGRGEIHDGPRVRWKPCPMCTSSPGSERSS